MNEIYKNTQEVMKNNEVQKAAEILAKYNLGVFVPHMHDMQTGEILPLPQEVITFEQNSRITFIRAADMESDMLPVAWRWNGNNIEVCGCCCIADAGTEHSASNKD